MSLALPLVESRGIYVCCDWRATNFRSASIRPGRSFGCSQPAQTHAPDAKPVRPLGTGAPEVQVADHSGAFPFPRGKRTPLVAAISSDGGSTWPLRKVLEDDPNGRYCYTAIHFT